LELSPGLAEVLRGEVKLRAALHLSESGGLAVLPAGLAEPRAQGLLLAKGGLAAVLEELAREGFEIRLIDCPAVLAAPEAAVMARLAGATYVVIAAERTSWEAAEKAMAALGSAGAAVRGAILNRFRPHQPNFLARLL
jgi:tyrosine-protein kinase Etk/Wzc